MENPKEIQLWKPVTFDPKWLETDTSILDDLKASWIRRRAELMAGSNAYTQFMEELKREHAIETGIVERLYDLNRGVSETLIKHGIKESYISHGDANIPTDQLMGHLEDQLEAVEFVFDVVGQERMITVGFIKQLHALTTQHQIHADGKDQFGKPIRIELKKGEFKTLPNNPTRDGIRYNYCPPEQVASEMDNLIRLYEEQMDQHPAILAAWFHHALSTIHPFQDGNGRVARLLASLILIKAGFFPFTVPREEARIKYIDALEKADNGDYDDLVKYFCQGQLTKMEQAISIAIETPGNLAESIQFIAKKLERIDSQLKQEEERKKWLQHIGKKQLEIAKYSEEVLQIISSSLMAELPDWIELSITGDYMYRLSERGQSFIMSLASETNLKIHPALQPSIVSLHFFIKTASNYILKVIIYNLESEISTSAITAYYLEEKDWLIDIADKPSVPIGLPPHLLSLEDEIEPKKKNIRKYLEDVMTIFLAKVAEEI